jgi:5-methylcytosine-specific restriction endonuclease McrA
MVIALLAERGGARCGICRFPIDLDLPGTDPMGPSIDHIVPRSRSGTDAPENLQLTHLRCNLDKSDSLAA